jgi:DNA-binding GntR family transcriptional regulator
MGDRLLRPPPSRQTAREVVAGYLRTEILRGGLEPGERLAVAELAEELNVSQTPVREALQQLTADGLVQSSAFRGAHVARLSADEYEEIFLMRVPLEGLAAELGAERIDADGIKRMRNALARMKEAAGRSDVDDFLQADREFHREHFLASGRDSLWNRIINMRYTAERYSRLGFQLPGGSSMAETLRSHREVLDAVKAHDGARARRVLVDDLDASFGPVYDELSKRAQEPASA